MSTVSITQIICDPSCRERLWCQTATRWDDCVCVCVCVTVLYACSLYVSARAAGGFPSQPRWRRSGQPARHSDWLTDRLETPRSAGQLTVRLLWRKPTTTPAHLHGTDGLWCNSPGNVRRHRVKLCVCEEIDVHKRGKYEMMNRYSDRVTGEGFTEQLRGQAGRKSFMLAVSHSCCLCLFLCVLSVSNSRYPQSCPHGTNPTPLCPRCFILEAKFVPQVVCS